MPSHLGGWVSLGEFRGVRAGLWRGFGVFALLGLRDEAATGAVLPEVQILVRGWSERGHAILAQRPAGADVAVVAAGDVTALHVGPVKLAAALVNGHDAASIGF